MAAEQQVVYDPDTYGGHALHEATAHGIPEVVSKMLESGAADANTVGRGDATALHVAGVSESGQHLVGLLVMHGAALEAVDATRFQRLDALRSGLARVCSPVLLLLAPTPVQVVQDAPRILSICYQ